MLYQDVETTDNFVLETDMNNHLLYILVSLAFIRYGTLSVLLKEEERWLILHYHKTGHDLTRAIFETVSNELGVSLGDNQGPRRTLWNVEDYVGTGKANVLPYFQSRINIQGGAEMHFKWEKVINVPYKVLHFVRDPFDYVVSAYLYHSQANECNILQCFHTYQIATNHFYFSIIRPLPLQKSL